MSRAERAAILFGFLSLLLGSLLLFAARWTYHREPLPPPPAPTERVEEVLDLNSATYQQLLAVPGIGSTLAQRIIRYRDSLGGIDSLEQLLEVKGIGRKKINMIKKYLKVRENAGEGT